MRLSVCYVAFFKMWARICDFFVSCKMMWREKVFFCGETHCVSIMCSCRDVTDVCVTSVKADLLHQWGGVVPKLAQDAHAQAIDKV